MVTAPDLLLYVQYVLCVNTCLLRVKCIQQQSRACFSTLHALGHLYTMSCTLYTCLFCVHCTILASQLGHGFEGGLPWRIPAPCTVHVATCTVHRAPCNLATCTLQRALCTLQRALCTVHRAPCTHRAKPHHRQSRGLSRKI